MVRGRDACWEHCVLVDSARQKVRCNYCQREFSGGVYRMKFHLAKIKNKDIVPCTEVPDGISNMISNMLSTASKYKPSKKPKIDCAINGAKNSSSATGDFHPNAESSGQNGSTCPSSLLPLPLPSPQTTFDDSQRKKYEDADKKIASFFFHNSIPFDASKSIYYQAMFDAVAECGNGYKAPSFGCLRSTLLEKEKGEMKGRYVKLREEWKETGCTILVNWWTNSQSMTILVFSVASPKGAFFLKSVEVSFHTEDSYFLFELLDSIVLDVGPENVIQVIVDNMDSCASVGRMLLKKYPSIFWSTCASRCIDTMLEDISKLELFRMVMEDVSTITQYIYSNVWIMNTMRKFTGGRELIRPKLTRYFTCFLSLRSLVIHEDNLKHMFSHGDWLSSPYSQTPEAQSIKSLLFLDRFWMSAREAVNVLEPLVKLLRIVDDEAPAVGYIYESIERAKSAIKMYYRGCEEKYMPICEIINGSWSMQLNTQLTSAAAFLNPSTFHNPSFKYDSNMRNGFHAAMQKMFPEEIDRIELAKEQPVYINSQGALGNEFAIIARKLNSPGDWWAAYGYEIPVLQRAAVRILSQPCSSNWCKWNWSTFEKLHSLKCNTLEQQKFSDLVFVHFNLRLQALNSHKESKCKAVVFDEIDVSCEWPSETEAPSLVLDDSWLDNLD